jgi:[ribosomal protein S18]-alanine N-acetyltransferase
MRPLILSAAQRHHSERLARWLAHQERFYAKFSPANLTDWLGEDNCFVLESGPDLIGFLLHLQVSRTVAAILAVGIGDNWETDQVVTPLLAASVQTARQRGVAQLSCVSSAVWLIAALQANRFQAAGCLASYLKGDTDVPDSGNLTVQVRPASPSDVSAIVDIDAAAFDPIWHEEQPILARSLQRNAYTIVAEMRGQVIGFSIGTSRAEHGHIGRLAVHPRYHGQGVGTRLLAESITRLRQIRVRYITLNTQFDNWTSRRLYERFGFQLVDCDTQVLIRQI